MLGLWREENQWTQRKVSVEERFNQVDFLALNDDVNQCLLWLVITHDLLELTDTCTWMRSWKTCFLCIVQHGTRFRKCLWDFFRLSKWKPRKELSRSYLFLFFSDHCIKQKDSILLWVCSVIDHRWRQNVVKTSVTHSACGSCVTSLFLPHFDIICDLLLNRCMATWNLFVKQNGAIGLPSKNIASVMSTNLVFSVISEKCQLLAKGRSWRKILF